MYVTPLRLANSSFLHFFFVKMNHLEPQLIVSLREVDSKVLRMAIEFEYFF